MAGTPLATAFVRIRPDTSGFKSETGRAVQAAGLGQLGAEHGKAFGANFTRSAGAGFAKIGGLLTAAFAVAGGVTLFKDMITGARDAERMTRLTAAVIKSTGGTAHVTASQVEELSTRLMEQAGVTRDVAAAGENMLLTFRGVRNETGKGNAIFDRASQAILDMTAAMHGGDVTAEGMRKTAILVGKALQDPVKGMTSLRRVGVALTDQQAKQVAAFVKSGDTLSAQKIILGELATEFGGAAKAMADPWQRFMTTLHEVGVSIGTALLGPLNKAISWIQATAIPAIGNLWKALAPKAASALNAAGAGFRTLLTGQLPAAPAAVSGHRTGSDAPPAAPWQRFLVTVHGVGAELVKAFSPVIAGLIRNVGVFAGQVVSGFRDLWTALGPVVKLLAGLAIGALLVGLRELGTLLAGVIGPAFQALAGFIKTNSTWFQALAAGILAIVAAMKLWALWGKIITGVTKLWAAAQVLLNVVMAANPIGLIVLALIGLAAAFYVAWTRSATFRKVVETAFGAVKGVVMDVVNWFTNSFVPFFTKTIPGVFQAVLDWVKTHWPWIVAGLGGPIGAVVALILANWGKITDFFTKTIPSIFDGAKNWIINNFIRPVINAFLNFAGTFVHGAATAFGWIPGIGGGLKNAAKAFDAFQRNVNASLDRLTGKTVAVNAQFKAVAGGTKIQGGYAGGGQVRGPGSGTSDSIPAWLSSGEYVVRADSVRRYGKDLFDALNAQQFAAGGLVFRSSVPSRAVIDRSDAAALQATANAAASAILAALAAGGPGGPVPALGGNVTGWIMAALAATGNPASWLPALLRLVSRESGGNPGARNPVTVMGEHASGLFQMLPSTFAQFATVAGGIWNPIANAVAALRYIAARYGSPFNIPNLFGGNYVGYAGGGPITEPILGVGRSGRMYGFGEHGPEWVTPGRGGGSTYHFHFSGPVASREAAKSMVLGALRDLERERRLP